MKNFWVLICPTRQFSEICPSMDRYRHQLKRLKHSINTFNSRPSSPNEETVRKSVGSFSISCDQSTKTTRPIRPAPFRARRGRGRGQDRYLGSLPKRTINYDLAESFMDHSSNPLSSDLYKIRFKHSAKQWPNGRFIHHREQFRPSDGINSEITCTRTFPLVPKRKTIGKEIEQKIVDPKPSIILVDPIVQEQKKKLADKQTNFYANLFGCGKIVRFSSTTQIKKSSNLTKAISSNSILPENKEDQQC